MPSVVPKPEKIPVFEGSNHASQALYVLEKKVRNLEKRKGKLDGYKLKLKQGETLNQDQQEAVDQYEVVDKTLLFARELSKQFTQLSAELEKQKRKQQKREQIERSNHEMKRIGEILKLQNLLNELGTEEVREDFLEGKNNAIILTEAQLDTLDELYKLISPSRDLDDEIPYLVQVATASEHIVCLLDAKDKEVIGSTYPQLRELITKIQNCGYFNKVEPEIPVDEEEKLEKEAEIDANDNCTTPSDSINENALMEGSCDIDTDGAYISQEGNDAHPWNDDTKCSPENYIIVDQNSCQVLVDHSEQVVAMEHLSLEQNNMVSSLESQEFHNPNYFISQPARPRPLNEIVSSVSGDFTFLQESTVMSEQEIPPEHVDPAVLAAHPMGANLVSSTISECHTQSVINDSQIPPGQQIILDETQSLPSQQTLDGYNLQPQENAYQSNFIDRNSLNQQYTTIDDNKPHLIIENTNILQSVDTFDVEDPDEAKKYTMNPNAAMFHSQYNNQNSNDPDDEHDEVVDTDKDFANAPNNAGNFGNYNNRGGPRGRGGRGGRGSFNGYVPRGGRGNNSQYNGRIGMQNRGSRGSYSNNRGNSRGSRSDRGSSRGSYNSNSGPQPSRINFASDKA